MFSEAYIKDSAILLVHIEISWIKEWNFNTETPYVACEPEGICECLTSDAYMRW